VSEPAFDELLRRLAAADVQFVLIGGLSLNAWGVVRGTRDVDIVPETSLDNLARIAEVATSAGGHVQTGTALAGSTFSIAALLTQGGRVMIETALGPLDVVQGLPGVPSHEELTSRSTTVEVLGTRVAVCALDDLRAMKRAAGRTRDLADLEDLETAHGKG